MKTILHILESRSPRKIWFVSLVFVFLLCGIYAGIGDVAEIEAVFILPVIIASWYGSRRSGVLLGGLVVILLLTEKHFVFGDILSWSVFFSYGLPYLITYFLVAIIITNFKDLYRNESDAAGTDYLTGLHNSRNFYIELASELVRSDRYHHTFSLAYIDIDRFKMVNDDFGHDVGDRLLVVVARCLVGNLRETDSVARLGGDEFACLMPETNSADAKNAFLKVLNALRVAMNKKSWPVTFSVGLVTFEKMPDSVKEVVKAADELMYSVKKKEKNNIAYRVWHAKA